MSRIRRSLCLLLLAATPAVGQSGPDSIARGDRFREVNAGFSWFSPRGGGWGMISDRRVYLTGLRDEWVIEAEGRVGWAYTVEWIPLVVVERTRRGETLNCYETFHGRICERDRSVRVAAGAGVAPVGIKMYVNRAGGARWFANAAAGTLVFSSDVPVYHSRRFNFTVEWGGGVELVRRDGRALTLGYRFHHISNASSGRFNPGLDANILYLGIRHRRP